MCRITSDATRGTGVKQFVGVGQIDSLVIVAIYDYGFNILNIP